MPHVDLRDPITNPVGNNLQDYSSAKWVNLGMAPTRVDFGALGVGTPLAAGTLPGGGTYTQAAGAGQAEETVQTSASTVARWAFVANLPRIGILADGGIGLVLEPPRRNELVQSRDLSVWTAGVATLTSNAAAGADGSVLADRVAVASGQYGPNQTPTGLTSSAPYVFSQWVRRGQTGVASTHGFWQQDGTTAAVIATEVGALADSWQRVANGVQTLGAATTAVTAESCEGRAVGGLVAQARDTMIDFSQVEQGKYPTSPLVSGASKASRAGYRVAIPISRYVRGGVFRAVLTTVPHGAATEYDGDSATIRLWTIDANTYAEVNTTTRVLTVSVNGVARVAGVPLWWLRGHRVQWSWEVGNGNLRVRYRYSTDQGATWTLPFDPFGGVVNVDSAISTASSTIDLYSDSGSSKWWGTGVVSEEAILTAPAWALQALPTDVASVKAFFRADSSYTLSAGTVSAWAGQTATAVTAFTQATGANQPTFAAAGLGTARPSFTFDGANDYLEAGALSGWITAATGCIYILFKCAAVSTNNAPNYNNHPLVENVGAYAGVALRTGPTAGAFNYDGTYDDASTGFALSTAQVVRWRHASGNVYVRATGSAESAATASGATALLTGNVRLGGNPGVVAVYYQGEIAAAIAANTDPTAAEDAAIMAFLNAYGGL